MERDQEINFYLRNDEKVNNLVCKILFIISPIGLLMMVFSITDMFMMEPWEPLLITGILLICNVILLVMIKKKVNPQCIKYFAVMSLEIVITVAATRARIGIYSTYILAPLLSCLYFDSKFTKRISVIGYVLMIIALFLRAPEAVTISEISYTPAKWFRNFAIGYTLEYVALALAIMSLVKRTNRAQKTLYVRNQKIEEMQNKLIVSFADLIESRDDSTGQHVKRTSAYVNIILDKVKDDMNISDDEAHNISRAAPLHDIGKIRIPDAILCKPGKLTDEEFEIIKSHTVEGEKLLEKTMSELEKRDYMCTAKNMALYHHEKWNGTGYPKGLKEEEIPLSARIMAVADVFDALTSERCYKKPISVDEAFEILEKSRGSHFQPLLVDRFIDCREQIKSILKS